MQKFFKLIVSASVLSLMFMVVSCKHNDSKDPVTPQNSNLSKELLEGIVNFDGIYSLQFSGTLPGFEKWVFKKDNTIQSTISATTDIENNYKIEWTQIEKITEVSPIDNIDGGYYVTVDVIQRDYHITDPRAKLDKDVNKITYQFIVSSDKKTITYKTISPSYGNELVLTYQD